MRYWKTFAIITSISVVVSGCGSSSDEPTNTREPDPTPQPDPPKNPGTIPCGNVKPVKTNYEGDDLCILPPDPSLGIQLHVGPSDYNDPAELAKYELAPGAEVTECYYLTTPNDETVNFFEQYYRMRPGSHHLIMNMNTQGTAHAEGWSACERTGYIPVGGTQRSVSEFPVDGKMAPEDENLFRPLLPHASMAFELHFVNSTNKPILREVWVNLMRKETNADSQILGGVFMIGGTRMQIAPHTKEILNYQCPPLDKPAKRIVSLFGHRHAHSTRFSVWAHRAGQRELIYEDYDWSEPLELQYNSVVKNPAPDATSLVGGGSSGILNFAQGDTVEWECAIDNTSDQPLEYPRNEVYTAEMCNLFGSSVGGAGETFWTCVSQRRTAPPAP